MRNLKLIFLSSMSFLLFFSSCVDHDYDLNDDKLDPNAVLSPDGMNVPIGNVERLLIFEKIGFEDVQIDTDGSLYIEYNGSFNPEQFKVPDYDMDIIEPISTSVLGVENLPPGDFDFSISSSEQNVPLLVNEIIEYELPDPRFEDGNWTIVPKQIIFDYLMVNIEFVLQEFSNVTGSAKVNLYLTLPDNFEVEDEILDNGRIMRTVEFDGSNPLYRISKGIRLKSYRYPNSGDANIIFDLELASIDDLKGTVSNPNFQLTFVAENETRSIHSIKGEVYGREQFSGEIDGVEDFKNSFGENDILQFANPSLFLSLNTNLGADIRFDIDKIDAHNGQSVSLAGNNGLMLQKPSGTAVKTTSYYVAPKNNGLPAGAIWKPLDLDKLFVSIPNQISYDFSINVNDPDAAVIYDGLVLDGEYKFKIPLSFENISLNLKIDPILLSDNLYDNVLQYVKEKLTIKADTVIISTEKFERLEITATINFLDAYHQVIDNSIAKSVTLAKGLNKDKFVFVFSEADLEKLVNAQYLDIEFLLQGKGELTKDDYIDINSLRIISDSGIHFEL